MLCVCVWMLTRVAQIVTTAHIDLNLACTDLQKNINNYRSVWPTLQAKQVHVDRHFKASWASQLVGCLFTSSSTLISSASNRWTRHDRVLLRPRKDLEPCWVAAAAAVGGGAAVSSLVTRPPSSKSTERLSRAGGGGWSVGSSRTDATSRPCCDHCWRRLRHSAWFFSTFIDGVDDDGGTAGRRRPALGDSVTGERADRPPPRDGIVDQLAVVVSSGVRASDNASLASVGTSCIRQSSPSSSA